MPPTYAADVLQLLDELESTKRCSSEPRWAGW
jgi:hypothetical protein